MLVKWITCRVVDRAAFDLGQQAWAGLHGMPGFLGQSGGWSINAADVAQIFGFWSDQLSYETFMDGAHDRIAAAQARTFDEIQVRVLRCRLDIADGFPFGLPTVSVLRLAHCHVRDRRQEHFVRAQAEVWNPGMAASRGMCGGVVAQCGDSEFLILSGWRTAQDHQRYRDEAFDSLSARAGRVVDLESVAGDVVGLVPNWTVLG